MSEVLTSKSNESVFVPTKSMTLKISRFNPSTNTSPKLSEYKIQKWTTVLDAILYVKQNLDHSVGVRYSCRMTSSGSCGMRINGYSRLACYTKLSELNYDVVTVESMFNFPVIRDLVVDFQTDVCHK